MYLHVIRAQKVHVLDLLAFTLWEPINNNIVRRQFITKTTYHMVLKEPMMHIPAYTSSSLTPAARSTSLRRAPLQRAVEIALFQLEPVASLVHVG